MEKIKPTDVAGAREYFSGELRAVIAKQQVSANPHSLDYLADLLLRYMQSEKFFVAKVDGSLENNVLYELCSEYANSDAHAKRDTLRRLGDICLLITGFFPDSLNRKLVDIDYYFGMGGTAYWTLSRLQLSGLGRALFKELALKFKSFADALGELSDRSGLQTNSDILRLYEKWLLTGSERLKKLLSEQGIPVPVKTDVKVKH